MLGFDNYEEEYLFHQKLSLAILYLSPSVVFILMGFNPPTYGKLATVLKTKQQIQKDQAYTGDTQTSSSSATCDVSSNTESSHASTLSLRKRRLSIKNENTSISNNGETAQAGADGVNDNSNRASRRDGENQQQQKEEKHWMGPQFPAKWSWVFFESPCLIWVAICLWDFHHRKEEDEEHLTLPMRNQILLGWFTFHYLYRAMWYPLVMMKATSARVPLGIVSCAWVYCCVNGYLQARNLTKFSVPALVAGEESLLSSQHEYQYWFGVLCIVIGFYINCTSDSILQRIKQEKQRKIAMRQSRLSNEEREESSNGSSSGSGSSRYAVPFGGFFEYVSSPHYFGELMEWSGFCIANNFSLASLSFAIWTAANLIPRAIHTHKWYNKTFAGYSGKCHGIDGDSKINKEKKDDDDCDMATDYSQLDRKAIIPFIL